MLTFLSFFFLFQEFFLEFFLKGGGDVEVFSKSSMQYFLEGDCIFHNQLLFTNLSFAGLWNY